MNLARAMATSLFTIALSAALRAQTPAVPPLEVHRTAATITVDGDLSDAGWQGAAHIDRFYETAPADNTEAKVKTEAWITYDSKYFYIGLKAHDPHPEQIRAPFVDRDAVLGTDDNIAVFLDTRGDKRSAMELRVNPRGIQGDAIFNDANGNEDFSPDFFYDTAAKITTEGWQAEMRIPFSSLRYPDKDPQNWNILIWRNYPRDFRYFIQSVPTPRGANCYMCFLSPLTGLTALPRAGHLVVAPYVTANELQHRRHDDLSQPFQNDPLRTDAGADVKWNPNADTTIDGTINPDFSQIEADTAQITVNQRFALFFPEKRPFFLEGVDLFSTPIQAVYTRTITSPRWGARATGKMGGTAYTMLVSEDRGGGLVIIPGALSSDFAAQDFKSLNAIGRLRHDIGSSFAGLLFTDREYEGSGHNRVIGPDFQWRPNGRNSLTGQYLLSDTVNPDRPDLSSAWDGSSLKSHAASLAWNYQTEGLDIYTSGRDFGDGFRADTGFVPQVGYREGYAEIGYKFYPHNLFNFLRPYAVADYYRATKNDETIGRSIYPGLFFAGRRNLQGNIQIKLHDQTRIGDQIIQHDEVTGFVQIDPSRRLPRIALNYTLGEQVDFANSRVGNGAQLGLTATIRPDDRLEMNASLNRQWLDLNGSDARGRLFTAQVERLKATYSFSSKSLLRVIGQYVKTDRNPALYRSQVDRHSGDFLSSILYSYKVNWQTVLFLGYGDDAVLTGNNDLVKTDRSLFLKISYALQR